MSWHVPGLRFPTALAGRERRDAGPHVPIVMERGPGDGAQKCSWGRVLRTGFVFMQFVCTVLYGQLLIIPSLVALGQIYLFSVLFNTQITTAGAFNEFFKKNHPL